VLDLLVQLQVLLLLLPLVVAQERLPQEVGNAVGWWGVDGMEDWGGERGGGQHDTKTPTQTQHKEHDPNLNTQHTLAKNHK
jgi:hypothetical protein